MSDITDVVLLVHAPRLSEEIMALDLGQGQSFSAMPSVDAKNGFRGQGGQKCFTMDVYVCGANYFQRQPFLEQLRAIPWGKFDDWTLILDWEGGDCMEVITKLQGEVAP